MLLTLALFPIYLALRHPYRRLPVHLDTGFFVPHHVVAGQVPAVLSLMVGLEAGSGWWCGLAAFLWGATCFAVNLSSIAGLIALLALAGWAQPWAGGIRALVFRKRGLELAHRATWHRKVASCDTR
ncbi:MAG: hypothetical protein GY778_24295 [bacterium]|nr:hypothetical protein [bacterium]